MLREKGSFRFNQFMLHIVQLFLYTITANILLSEFSFLLGCAISWYTLPSSFLVGLLCLTFFYEQELGQQLIGEIIATLLLFLFLTGVCGKLFDFSYDGNTYHKLAIGLLKNHWNPLMQLQEEMTADVLRVGPIGSIWVECYAKGAWIFAAGVYGITGNIECGKVYTLISMICAFFLTYYCMQRCGKGHTFSFAFSIAAALNPVALQQMTSFYVDGYLHIILYILLLSLAMLIMLLNQEIDKREKRIFSSIAACSMIICGTIKFSGLLYGGIYCIVYFLYYGYYQLKSARPRPWSAIGKCFFRFTLLAAVTILWAGADCYVMNTIRHGSPVYPLYGEGAIDIITLNSSFGEVNRIKNLLVSLFSKVSNPIFCAGGTPELKVPFTVDWSSEPAFSHGYDCRISGFGVFFSGLLIIAVISIFIKLIKEIVLSKSTGSHFELSFWVIIILSNTALCLAITESWWARYSPYIYYTFLIGIFFALEFCFSVSQKRLRKVFSIIIFSLILSNSLICLHGTTADLQKSATVRKEIQELKTYVQVETDTEFLGIYFNLKDQNIYYLPNNYLKSSGIGNPLTYMGVQVFPR